MIGEALPRREDARVLRGETRYLDDIDRPRQVHAAFVRSPHAHAAITEMTIPDLPPDVAVLRAGDLGDLSAFPVMRPDGCEIAETHAHPVLAGDEVRYVGQPVALVAAPTRALAEDAAEAVEVEYEPRPVELDPRTAPVTMMRWARRSGDVAAAFATARHVIRGDYALPRLVAAPMETRGVIAEHEPEADRLTVWCSAQDVHRPLAQLSHILGRAPDSIHLIVPDVGGAFGSKGVIAPEVAAVAAAAIRLGAPVKWAEDRLENLVGTYQGRGVEGELELALDTDGRILGLQARLWADLGGYLLTTTPVPPHTAATLIAGCYDIPAARVEVTGVQTNKVPTGPYRGAGRPDAAYMIEALIDDAARQTGIDRVALRRRNLIRTFPYRTVTGLEYDSGDFESCLDLALAMLEDARAAGAGEGALAVADPGDAPAVPGTGIALYVERAGGGWESARIELAPGGRFEVASSSSPHGQGHDITFAQIAADRLHVAPDAVELSFGDSATSPPGVGTFGSRSVSQAGSAVALAADDLVRRATERAARRLGVEPPVVRLTAAGFAPHGEIRRAMTWAELAADGLPRLRAEARFQSANVFSSGAYAADVAIDSETGTLTVRRLVAVDDAGTLINPLLARGQVIGGIVQALGECLTEEAVYDDAGQLRSGSFLDYNLLTAAEVPPIATGEIVTPSPLNPLGAKGAGEGGAVGTVPAIANAVADALGGRRGALPFSAERLWQALHGDEPRPAR
ncbi:MAG TPA: xanthine dehydrogenase family protein molybdopterin-binding subunit [Solirubrobacteraceae bacterium]